MISKQIPERLLFLWIPKTGGTSVYDSLSSVCYFPKEIVSPKKIKRGTHGHFSLHSIYDMQELFQFDIFTVVRNPYDRIVSLFFYLKKVGQIPNDVQFTSFVTRVTKKPIPPVGFYNHNGFNQANKMLDWTEGVPNLKIFKFEQINDCFHFYGLEPKKLNTTEHKTYLSYYNKDTIEMVNSFYREDFSLFNYEMM